MKPIFKKSLIDLDLRLHRMRLLINDEVSTPSGVFYSIGFQPDEQTMYFQSPCGSYALHNLLGSK